MPPDCYPAYAFSKRALQATTMAAIDAAARLDRDWLSRGMSDPGSLRAQARRYRELRGKDIKWASLEAPVPSPAFAARRTAAMIPLQRTKEMPRP